MMETIKSELLSAKICKLCGHGLAEDEIWLHLVSKHPKEIRAVMPIKLFKCSCGRKFKARIDISTNGDFYRPVFCPACQKKNPIKKLVVEIWEGM